MDTENLLKIGLTEGEARVYLALLETGSATVGPVVKKSGVAYSNVYEILGRLMKKGLVSFVIRSKTKYFQAMEPLRLYEYVENKEKEIKKERRLVDEIVPELSMLSRTMGERLEAEVFIGPNGMKTAYEKMASGPGMPCDYVYFYGPEKALWKRIDKLFLGLDSRVYAKSKIKMRGITSRDYYRNSYYINKSMKIKMGEEEVRYVDFPVPGNIDICGDSVLLASWSGSMIAVLVHSKDIADSFRKYFESVWKIAKK